MELIRRQGRRFAWLMAGAAIALAVALLLITVTQVEPITAPAWVTVMGCLAVGAGLGLVPGVREIEVIGTRSMLGAKGALIVPRHPRPAHHAQTMAWVLLHLVSGFAVAVVLVAILPTAVLVLLEIVTGGPAGSLRSEVPLPASGWGQAAAAVLAALTALVALGAGWPIGALLARFAPRLLGPTTHDRLEFAETRAAREADSNRIARELHDGIGHALTIVSVQAAVARRIQEQNPVATAEALQRIETTAREATAELDGMLALLREEPREFGAPGEAGTPPGLEQIITAHRQAGMELRAQVEVPPELAELQQRHLVRIVTELLTNAQRHGASGPVELVVASAGERLTVEVMNPRPDGRPAGAERPGGGHGLTGLRERAELLGGRLNAGPDGGYWVARADLPLLREGPPR